MREEATARARERKREAAMPSEGRGYDRTGNDSSASSRISAPYEWLQLAEAMDGGCLLQYI